MNKTEARFAQLLEYRKRAGEILWWSFDAINLRLADNEHIRVDFFVVDCNAYLICYEVKGFWRDDARAKLKMAASLYPFKFVAVQDIKGEWVEEKFYKE